MNVMETEFQKRLENLEQRKQEDVQGLRTALAAAVRAQYHRMLTFAQRLQSRKDWKGPLEKIVRAVLTERGYLDLMSFKR